jgi:predicted O-methyltransferase YrrM
LIFPISHATGFEHLSGLFASTTLDHGVIALTIRQTAYMFGLARQMKARKVVEVGRYKGGSTLALAVAIGNEGHLWSIDIGEKESRLHAGEQKRTFDMQLRDRLQQLDLNNVDILVGDSRIVDFETKGEVDLVFIDGDHSYELAKNDFERFGRRVRVGGAVLFDDAIDDGVFKTHSDTVGKVVQEAISSGQYKLVQSVNHLAHIERIS